MMMRATKKTADDKANPCCPPAWITHQMLGLAAAAKRNANRKATSRSHAQETGAYLSV